MTDAHHNAPRGNRRHTDEPQTPYDRARAVTTDATRRTVEAVEGNPLGILVGGLAVGALAGALLPRSDKERELLAPVGKRLGETARAAADAAKQAGHAELQNRGLTADAGRDQFKSLLGNVAKALSSAGAAGAKAATNKSQAQDENAPA